MTQEYYQKAYDLDMLTEAIKEFQAWMKWILSYASKPAKLCNILCYNCALYLLVTPHILTLKACITVFVMAMLPVQIVHGWMEISNTRLIAV